MVKCFERSLEGDGSRFKLIIDPPRRGSSVDRGMEKEMETTISLKV